VVVGADKTSKLEVHIDTADGNAAIWNSDARGAVQGAVSFSVSDQLSAIS